MIKNLKTQVPAAHPSLGLDPSTNTRRSKLVLFLVLTKRRILGGPSSSYFWFPQNLSQSPVVQVSQ
jgi:hypothetical protein